MTGNRSKGAWIWVAMAAISLASLARSSPVLKTHGLTPIRSSSFLPRHQADAEALVRRIALARCREPAAPAWI